MGGGTGLCLVEGAGWSTPSRPPADPHLILDYCPHSGHIMREDQGVSLAWPIVVNTEK